MNNAIIEGMGWLGAAFFLVAYFNVVRKKWGLYDPIYHAFNVMGGILLAINTVYNAAWAATFINAAWAAIAVAGLIQAKRKS